jgi:hypothetical protein
MPIQYAGKISKDDFLKAIFLNSPQLKLQKWIIGILLSIMAFSFFFLVVSPSKLFDSNISKLLPSLLPGLVVFLIIVTFPWWIPYLQLSSFDQKGNIYRNNVFGMIDDTGITINSAEIKANFQWNVFVDYKISKDIFMLYQSKNCFNMFKPSMFSNQDEWEKFISFAKDKVSVNKKRA